MAVGVAEYRGGDGESRGFLRTGGRSLAAPAESARERLSAEMDFEGAALMHQRCQRIGEVLGLARRNGGGTGTSHRHRRCAVGREERGGTGVAARRLLAGILAHRIQMAEGNPFRSTHDCANWRWVLKAAAPDGTSPNGWNNWRCLARWFYSSWCDGELLMVDDWTKIPYRKLVNAVSRIAHGPAACIVRAVVLSDRVGRERNARAPPPIQWRDIP